MNANLGDCLITLLIINLTFINTYSFIDKSYLNENMNLYTPQFIYDIDHDGVMDVLQIHGGDPMA